METPAQRRGRNNKRRGASIERTVARLVGGKRIGNRGTSSADVTTEDFAIEVKSVMTPTPAWLKRAWSQAEKAAAETGLLPLIIRSHKDGNRRTYWVIAQMEGMDGDEEG